MFIIVAGYNFGHDVTKLLSVIMNRYVTATQYLAPRYQGSGGPTVDYGVVQPHSGMPDDRRVWVLLEAILIAERCRRELRPLFHECWLLYPNTKRLLDKKLTLTQRTTDGDF